MNALALFPHDAPTAPVEPTDAELDAYAAWYTLAPWAPDLDDPAKLARWRAVGCSERALARDLRVSRATVAKWIARAHTADGLAATPRHREAA